VGDEFDWHFPCAGSGDSRDPVSVFLRGRAGKRLSLLPADPQQKDRILSGAAWGVGRIGYAGNDPFCDLFFPGLHAVWGRMAGQRLADSGIRRHLL